jgi:alanine racemase
VARDLGVELVDSEFTDVDVPGLIRAAAYGLAPESRPVLTLVGEVVSVKRVAADAGVSYGYSYRTAAPTTLALVALGYADGVPRLASNRATVQVGSGRHPLVGRVAMDQFVVDCGDDAPEVGSDAVLFGDPDRGAPSALDWATATERSPLALTAGLGQRISREAR